VAYSKDPLVFGKERGDVPRRRVVILVWRRLWKCTSFSLFLASIVVVVEFSYRRLR